MGVIGDIQTAITGHLWVVQNSKIHEKRIDSLKSLIDLEHFIRNDQKLALSTLPAIVHKALSEAQAQFPEKEEDTTLDICAAGAVFLFGMSILSYCIHGSV